MPADRDEVVLVLYQPQDVVNVASIIRVMSNFGLRHLRLIEPAAFDPYRIEGIAHHTETWIQAVQRYPSLADALSDCHYVVGTTGRPRHAARPVYSPRALAAWLHQGTEHGPSQRVAILFGSEQDGLPNEALDLCHAIVTIPTDEANRSLNLAQAALVVAYELWMAADTPTVDRTADCSDSRAELPPGIERERMFTALESLLQQLYPGTTPTRLAAAMSRFRTLLMRAVPSVEETAALQNLWQHIRRAIRPQ